MKLKNSIFNYGWQIKFIVSLLTAFIGYKLFNNPQYSPKQEIELTFLETWADYELNAWGYDIYSPISHDRRNMPHSNEPMGWIIVDSIDTMMIMYNKTDNIHSKAQFLKSILKSQNWVENTLNYDIDAEINIFETTIRMLGGLLSAYYYSEEFDIGNSTVYLKKAIDLADRLAISFDQSPSGIPYSSINLHTGKSVKNHIDNGASSTAEFTTLQLEMKYLSYLTNNSTYWKYSEAVYKPLYENNNILEKYDGLVPIYTNPDTSLFFGENIRLGSRGDSFYEYLLKQYLLTHETLYYNLYRTSIRGIKKHLVSKSSPNGLVYIGEKEHGIHGPLSPKMDHLVCFLGGLLAMGATNGLNINDAQNQAWWDAERQDDWKLAEDLTYTCYQMYDQTPSGLAPEIVVFNNFTNLNTHNWWKSLRGDFYVKPLDKHNLQRPETVESLMFLYHLTKDEKYRKWGWEIFENFRKHTKVQYEGSNSCTYTSLKNCIDLPIEKSDNIESFWLAETLKYLYLLFDDDVDLTQIVFNTEAHPFPVMNKTILQKSGLGTGISIH